MKIVKHATWLALAASLLTACLSSDDTETVTYNDTAITSFSLGTLNRYLTRKASDGVTDSTYKTTVAGSAYKFYIDQATGEIYNPDSLPYGTDVSRVVTTIYSKNSGAVYLLNLSGDSLRAYSSSDSIDFTVPRTYRVYASSGAAYRSYTVTVNVHQEPADTMLWTLMPAGTEVPEGVSFGASSNQYKIDGGALMKSSDGGSSWSEEALDDDASWLPDDNVNFCSVALSPAKDSTDLVVLVGTGSADAEYAVAWTKRDCFAEGAAAGEWSRVANENDNRYRLPKLSALQVVRYGSSYLVAIGGAGLDKCTEEAYSAMYVSRDNGISWHTGDGFQLPEDFDTSATNVTMLVDSNGYLWLVCEGTGQIWRGKQGQYSIENVQTAFRE